MSVIRTLFDPLIDFVSIRVLPHFGGDKRTARLAFIDAYRFPERALSDLAAVHPGLDAAAEARVFDALKSFFAVHAVAPGGIAGMPSRIVEDAWLAFSRCAADYARFCERACGHFIEPPAGASSDGAIARTWAFSCAREGVDARRPSRLPKLFAIDRDLKVRNGRYYALNEADSEMALRVLGASAIIVLAAGLGSTVAPDAWQEIVTETQVADAYAVPGIEMAASGLDVGGFDGGGGVGGDG